MRNKNNKGQLRFYLNLRSSVLLNSFYEDFFVVLLILKQAFFFMLSAFYQNIAKSLYVGL